MHLESALCSCRRNRFVWIAVLFSAVSTSTPLLVMCTGLMWCLMFIMWKDGGAFALLPPSYCTRCTNISCLRSGRFLKCIGSFFFFEWTRRIDSYARANQRGFPSKNKTSIVLLKIKRGFFFTPSGCLTVCYCAPYKYIIYDSSCTSRVFVQLTAP